MAKRIVFAFIAVLFIFPVWFHHYCVVDVVYDEYTTQEYCTDSHYYDSDTCQREKAAHQHLVYLWRSDDSVAVKF